MPRLACPECSGSKWEYEPDDMALFNDRVETLLLCTKCKQPVATLLLFNDGRVAVKWSKSVDIGS